MSSDVPWTVERMVRRDRLTVALGLAAIALVAWLYLLRSAAVMTEMAMDARMHAAMGMADARVWGAADWAGLFVMWAVMMVAMMLPSAAPVILIVLGAYRRRGNRRARLAAAAFVMGYVLAWTGFSILAAGAQVWMHRVALLSADMATRSALVAGVILITAGVYQWLPVKTACLMHCRSPFGFLAAHWRDGAGGALSMGLRHGLFCIGCCWSLMALLFVVGVMNLLWVAAIAAFVLVEKVTPHGRYIGRAAGALLILWGVLQIT